MALICEIIYNTNKANFREHSRFLAKGCYVLFNVLLFLAKILFAVFRQKADCYIYVQCSCIPLCLRSSLMVFHDCDTSHCKTSA